MPVSQKSLGQPVVSNGDAGGPTAPESAESTEQKHEDMSRGVFTISAHLFLDHGQFIVDFIF